ncbi:MAG: tRNA uridine-5-carboxymethylaminomethyl(34) synthesis enzyme MnmG [Clostridiales bacterium]|jgi:tRNA uridine 5-carboxymethylaminomethyl modification enzyme|nr:tRNA uridine-5-carboxymethylaminomethyl(34) synthesis enzyme MnmG [Clostridiales bacterium]
MTDYDVVIIGGGHAGCEAALACARMGVKTIMFVMNLDSIAMMPCNPNIGGTSKGHLVREIDALGGEMAKNIDKTFIQSRMLNTGKGPAVHSLRAQADKAAYATEMLKTLQSEPNLSLRQSEVTDISVQNGELKGVFTRSGAFTPCKAAVICVGTYMRSRCLCGDVITDVGPNGLKNAKRLSESFAKLDVSMMRFKTGTPARIDGATIDRSKMQIQPGDEVITPFSFDTDASGAQRVQVPCYLTYTNERTHRIIRQNLSRSPIYSNIIEGTGARYCPSIEDKIVRFADKDRHQVFIEPEGENTTEMYVSGMSTSMPEDVQEAMYRTVPGLENCRLTRNGYAIEYDCIDATQLTLSLEFKHIKGLFSAGQFNGSSGYEEAAAQGLVAGINAALFALKKPAMTIDRSEGYIGVLIDDLTAKGSDEPYRMMTSRAEYRLLLRQDNADLRLMPKGYAAGLVPKDRFERFEAKRESIEREIKRVGQVMATPEANAFLRSQNSAELNSGVPLRDLIKRPELDYLKLAPIDRNRPKITRDVAEQVNVRIKFEGYIKRQTEQVERFKRLEDKKLPENIDYSTISGLRIEARQKLSAAMPANIGRASRITGVSPSDTAVLLAYIKKARVQS